MAETPSLDDLRIDREPADDGGSPWVVPAAIILLLLLAAALVWWKLRPMPPEVRTAQVEALSGAPSSNISTVLDASGYVTARRQATVSSKITGKVVEVMVEEGMRVEKGQPLARLDQTLQQRQVALAQAELEASRSSVAEIDVAVAEAKINLDRMRRLAAADAASQSDLDTMQARVDTLAAQLTNRRSEIEVRDRVLALRRQELEDTVIRAPFTGVAVSKDAQPGEMISPVSAGGGFTRTGICTLVDMDSLEIEVDVNEAYIQRVDDGQEVVATLDAYPDWEIPARVITTIPAADRQKATVRVRIGFAELDPRILPDMGVKVSFLDTEVAESEVPRQAWVVPETAVRSSGDQAYVFVVEGKRVERRAVRAGATNGEEIEILAGLKTGDRVVVEVSEELEDGQKVRPIKR